MSLPRWEDIGWRLLSSPVSNYAVARCLIMPDGPVKVLLVEDDQDDYFLTRDLFEALPAGAYTLDRVASFEEAVESLSRCEHDIFLVDYRLGAHTGLELLAVAQAAGCGT